MTIRLTFAQVENLRALQRGVSQCPPLHRPSVDALIRQGYATEKPAVPGLRMTQIELTDKGRDF